MQSSPIYAHHQKGIEKFLERFRGGPECVAIILGGSIAKNLAREDSDIDIILVVTESAFSRYREENRLSFLLWDICDYSGGYIDVKVVSPSFLQAAAERGSEPTRNSFVAAKILFARDESLGAVVRKIGVYPHHLQQERITSFYSQIALMRGYFWPHAYKTGDLYLKGRAASDIVLFGFRLLLAHNQVLFPCHKSLRNTVIMLPESPRDIIKLADDFLSQQTEGSMAAFCDAIENFRDWGITKEQWDRILTRFIDDTEKSWLTHTPALSDV